MSLITVARQKPTYYPDGRVEPHVVVESHSWPASLCRTFRRMYPDSVVSIDWGHREAVDRRQERSGGRHGRFRRPDTDHRQSRHAAQPAGPGAGPTTADLINQEVAKL